MLKMRDVTVTITAQSDLTKKDIKDSIAEGLPLDFEDRNFDVGKITVEISK